MAGVPRRLTRPPEFLARVPPKGVQRLFGGGASDALPLFVSDDGGAAEIDDSELQISAGVESLAPPLPAPPAQMTAEMTERLAAAIADLRRTGERLAVAAADDAVEIACFLARRILEAEVKTDVEVLRGLVRSAVARLGEVHKVTIHLAPADVESVRGHAGEPPLGGLGIAKVDIVADTNLTPGDCLVESDAAKVDGRLGTRIEELRRVIATVMTDVGTDKP